MENAWVSYVGTEIFLMVFAATILLRLNINLGSVNEIRELKKIIYAFEAMLISDIIWALVEAGVFQMPRLPFAAVNAVSLIATVYGSYVWLCYVQYRMNARFTSQRRMRLFMRIVLGITAAADILSIFTGWVFYIDGQGQYCYGNLYAVQMAGCYVYLLIATVKSLKKALAARSAAQRSEYLVYAFYILPPLTASLIKGFVPTLPLFDLAMFLSILFLFLSIQDRQIYNDALTGLNNRRRLNQYLDGKLSAATEKEPVSVFMIDVDDFKRINDCYGHVEGDRALRMVSETLKKTAVKYNAFAARYGGDEFTLVWTGGRQLEEEIVEYLHKTLKKTREERMKKNYYRLTVSVGWVVCDVPGQNAEDILSFADQELYKEKQRKNKNKKWISY